MRLVGNERADHISAVDAEHFGLDQRSWLHQFAIRESAASRLRGNQQLRKNFAIN
jgi:hypothetical protein